MNTQFKKGLLELCVLTLLSRRDYYGYELVKELSRQIEVTEGSIYPILRRLTQESYFETYFLESSEGPSRKYYRMTAKGKQTQARLLTEWKEFNKQINRILKHGEPK